MKQNKKESLINLCLTILVSIPLIPLIAPSVTTQNKDIYNKEETVAEIQTIEQKTENNIIEETTELETTIEQTTIEETTTKKKSNKKKVKKKIKATEPVTTEEPTTQQTYGNTYALPWTSGFKSFMPYTAITSLTSLQYKLQSWYAYTGTYGIRQVNGRYCVAIGTYFGADIGDYIDLNLANGYVIECIVADIKADCDTDASNIIRANGCASEFIVDMSCLNYYAKRDGDISSCYDGWESPVSTITVYDINVFGGN